MLMQEFDTFDELVVEKSSFLLGQSTFAYDVVKQLSAFSVFHYHVDRRFGLYNVVQLDNVAVLNVLKNLDLSLDSTRVFQLSNLLSIHNLNGNFLLRVLVNAKPDFAESALTEVALHEIIADLFQFRGFIILVDAHLGVRLTHVALG